MDYAIIYFSGTGNTALVSEEIKKRLVKNGHNVDLLPIEENDILTVDLKNKIIGFGYPVYKFTYPDIFEKFMTTLNKAQGSYCYFQFSTYARFDAYAFDDFSRKLDPNKFTLIGEKSFKSPSCGISCRKPNDDYEYESVMFFENEIDKRLDEFVELIIMGKGINKHASNNPLRRIKKSLIKNIEITKYPKLTIDLNKCINCGLCTKKCPENNLVKNISEIVVKDDVHCLHCLRCMNHCPSNAIDFGILSQGDNQYTLKIRDQLFNKSLEGYVEKYWLEFDEVVKRWKKATIKYWLSKKLKIK